MNLKHRLRDFESDCRDRIRAGSSETRSLRAIIIAATPAAGRSRPLHQDQAQLRGISHVARLGQGTPHHKRANLGELAIG